MAVYIRCMRTVVCFLASIGTHASSHKCEKITLALKCVRECEGMYEILTAGQSAWLDRSLDGGERRQVGERAIFISYRRRSGAGSSVSCYPKNAICIKVIITCG